MQKPLFCLALLGFALSGLAQTIKPDDVGLDPTGKLLQQLANAPGPSGYEEAVRAIMVPDMKPYATSLQYDGLGSVIAKMGTTGPRIMIDAHMDELGGMVRRVTPQGFLTMQMLGGWLNQALVDQRWVILGSKGPVLAVTGIRDIHVIPLGERNNVYPRDSLFLDIGAKSAGEVAAMGIRPGDPIVPDSPFAVMNGTDNYLGKAWDDRAGCAILIEAMKRLASGPHPNQLFFVASTQEEIGLRGAHTAAAVVRPDIGIALEAGVTGDVLNGHPEESQIKLGAGPGYFLYDASDLPNRKMVRLFRETAAARKIPLQYDLVTGYGDDAAAMQSSGGGAPSINLVVPVRYTHAHNGIMNRKDFDQMVDLLVSVLQQLDERKVQELRDFTPSP
jgi:endoglucanase